MPLLLILILVLCASATSSMAQTVIHRINCGGPVQVVTPGGLTFIAEQPYAPGGWGYVGGSNLNSLGRHVPESTGGYALDTHEVYLKSRMDWDAYRFDVPNGDYIVRLFLSELHNQGVGIRSMDISLEGVLVLDDVDLAAELGVQYAGIFTAPVTVTDQTLDIEAAPGPGVHPPEFEAPIICGIEIWTAPASYPGPATVTGTTATSSYHMNILTWDDPGDATVASYLVQRSDSQTGPFTTIGTVWAQPNRYIDLTAVEGQEHWYRVLAVDVAGNMSGFPAPVSATAMDSSQSALPVWEIDISPADLLYISRNIHLAGNDEVPAVFTANGQSYNVNVRFRGNSGRWVSKKSWKVKFQNGETFLGRNELNIKAHFTDSSLLRERLSMDLWRTIGQSAQEVTPIHLKLNGEFAGVFNELEQMDEEYLSLRNRDRDASLYKCDAGLQVLGSPSAYAADYERKTNSELGLGDLINFITFINGYTIPGFYRQLHDQFDVDAYLTYLAMDACFGDWDSILHNFYLSNDHDLDNRWEILPYDSDSLLGIWDNHTTNFFSVSDTLSILAGTPGAPGVPSNYVNGLREAVLSHDPLLWRYCEKIEDLIQRYFNAGHMQPLIQQYYNSMQPDADVDPYKKGWESSAIFAGQNTFLQNWVTPRVNFMLAEIATVKPAAAPTDVWINEVAASAHDTFMDEMGEFEDWVELYNASAAPVDVGGMYMTDDLALPTKWQIPASTIIPAGGYLVIYCDNEPGDGPLHTPFRLKTEGEEIALVDTDGITVLDAVMWSAQQSSMSYGRYADGKPFFEKLPMPTPGAANTTAGNIPPETGQVKHVPAAPMSTDNVVITCLARDSDGLTSVDMVYRADGGAWTTVAMTPLPADRWSAPIGTETHGTLVEYYIVAVDSLGAVTENPFDGANLPASYTVNDPQQGALRVVEMMAKNNVTVQDEVGEYEDWIEIHNTTGAAVTIGGMYLTDDLTNPTKWQIPAGTSVPAGGHVLVWADNEPFDGPLHANFRLSALGESVGLYDVDGTTLLDGFNFTAQTADTSIGHMPDNAPNRYLLLDPSPGGRNRPLQGGHVRFDHVDPSINVADLAVVSPPVLASTLVMQVSNAAPQQGAFVFYELSTMLFVNPTYAVQLVPFNPFFTTPFATDPSGAATVSEIMPSLPALAGISFYAQAYIVGTPTSSALALTLGP